MRLQRPGRSAASDDKTERVVNHLHLMKPKQIGADEEAADPSHFSPQPQTANRTNRTRLDNLQLSPIQESISTPRMRMNDEWCYVI
jgi:hypothetical protein